MDNSFYTNLGLGSQVSNTGDYGKKVIPTRSYQLGGFKKGKPTTVGSADVPHTQAGDADTLKKLADMQKQIDLAKGLKADPRTYGTEGWTNRVGDFLMGGKDADNNVHTGLNDYLPMVQAGWGMYSGLKQLGLAQDQFDHNLAMDNYNIQKGINDQQVNQSQILANEAEVNGNHAQAMSYMNDPSQVKTFDNLKQYIK